VTDNRYAPPKAKLADAELSDDAPALWNPNAAANWSLLLTPAFGAYLHMRNWQALGEPDKAAASRNWIYVTLGMISLSVIAGVLWGSSRGLEALSRLVGFALLLVWYFSSGRAQAAYVKERFGNDYARKGWGKPLLAGFGAIIGFFFLVGIILGVLVSFRRAA
jgi:hypothetical protein